MFLLKNKKILPGFGISFGSSMFFICLILLLPMSALIMQLTQMSWYQYWQSITSPDVLIAYKITILSSAAAALFNALFGMLMAWILTRYNFPGKIILDGLMDLPFALPTAVAGLTLAILFSKNGWYGNFLEKFDITVSYTCLGIIIAMIFTSIPFVVRNVQPVLENINPEYEEAAKILGATHIQIFYYIILPELLPALLIGTMLSFVRSLGEFGAVIFIAGNIALKTEVLSLIIFIHLQEFDYLTASAIASVMLTISLVLLLIVNQLQLNFVERMER